MFIGGGAAVKLRLFVVFLLHFCRIIKNNAFFFCKKFVKNFVNSKISCIFVLSKQNK